MSIYPGLKVFDVFQARHFCVEGAKGATPPESLKTLYKTKTKATVFEEGTPEFNVYRASVLHSSERWLLYATSQYRRSLDMLVPASAPWAQVSLYYSAFYAANAILGMFGGALIHVPTGNRVASVVNGIPGQQKIQIEAKRKSPNDIPGTHKQFWDFFYDAADIQFRAWGSTASLRAGLDAPQAAFDWQIDVRNDVNYDMATAWKLSMDLHQEFDPKKFPATLPSNLATQLETAEGLIASALDFASQVQLGSGGCLGCGASGGRVQVQRNLIKQRPPRVIDQSALASMLGA